VLGPSGATDNAVARFDGTTGYLLQDSLVTIGDSGEVLIMHTADENDNRSFEISTDGAGFGDSSLLILIIPQVLFQQVKMKG